MESITISGDQLTNSVEEDEQDVRPVVRSYGCIFCRRGFTTAQALGGHMNIHRKDRAKSRPSYLSNNNNNNSIKLEDHSFYANPRFYNTSDNQEGYNIRYATSTSSTSQSISHESHQEYCHGVIKSPSMEENNRMSLSLQFGWSHGEDDKDSKRKTLVGRNEDGLDLELRLGHDP